MICTGFRQRHQNTSLGLRWSGTQAARRWNRWRFPKALWQIYIMVYCICVQRIHVHRKATEAHPNMQFLFPDSGTGQIRPKQQKQTSRQLSGSGQWEWTRTSVITRKLYQTIMDDHTGWQWIWVVTFSIVIALHLYPTGYWVSACCLNAAQEVSNG